MAPGACIWTSRIARPAGRFGGYGGLAMISHEAKKNGTSRTSVAVGIIQYKSDSYGMSRGGYNLPASKCPRANSLAQPMLVNRKP